MHETEQILVGVAETHPAPDPRLVERGRAGHVEGDHALVGVPDVDHTVGVLVGGRDLQGSEQLRPVVAQLLVGTLDLVGAQIALDHRLDRLLVDGLRARRIELGLVRVLPVAEHEDDLLRFAWGERQLDVV